MTMLYCASQKLEPTETVHKPSLQSLPPELLATIADQLAGTRDKKRKIIHHRAIAPIDDDACSVTNPLNVVAL